MWGRSIHHFDDTIKRAACWLFLMLIDFTKVNITLFEHTVENVEYDFYVFNDLFFLND